jgi:streptogramin lyase
MRLHNLAAVSLLMTTTLWGVDAQAADGLLSGVVKSASGAPMAGASVSAKEAGSPITTAVFTDENGVYVFPAMPAGKYHMLAQAAAYKTVEIDVDLDAKTKQNFMLNAATGDIVPQLSGDMLIDALPDSTPQDAQMKLLLRNNCTGCHTISYPLQHRFDQAGWYKIINLMKTINVEGVRSPKPRNPVLAANQTELAAYLARARGPGPTSMRFDRLNDRPKGEAARVVFKEYDVPANQDAGLPNNADTVDGTDWSKGSPSALGNMIHDAEMDLQGNLWFTTNSLNTYASVTKVDAKTGQVTPYKIQGPHGFAANSHGMRRDPNGFIWFTAFTGRGDLAKLDPATGKITVYDPPAGMIQTGGATSIDYDGKGMIWVSAVGGALRFDPKTETFTQYISRTQKTANGGGATYGVAADGDGNGFWAEMVIDTIGRGDGKTGQVSEIKLAPVKSVVDAMSEQDRAKYSKMFAPDFNVPLPWNQGPRRMGSDHADNVIYVGDSWGGNIARIDTKTLKVTYIPMPDPAADQPYLIRVDKDHNLWGDMWSTDRFFRYNPTTKQWTFFDIPDRGTEVRDISAVDTDQGLKIVLPYYRPNKVSVMSFRSEDELRKEEAAAN